MIGNPILPQQTDQTGVTFFGNFVTGAVGLGFLIGVLFFFGTLLMGAIQWISSGGDKSSLEAARGKITNAIIGIVILFSIYAIIQAIQYFFGITILTLDLAPLVIQ